MARGFGTGFGQKSLTGQPEAEKGTGFFFKAPVRNVTGGMHAEATERRSISGDEATGFSAASVY